MPDIRMATFGSNPISSGASTVEPNMATTCCAPMATFLGQDSLSSGAMMTPGSASSAGASAESTIWTWIPQDVVGSMGPDGARSSEPSDGRAPV